MMVLPYGRGCGGRMTFGVPWHPDKGVARTMNGLCH